jgi:hypothetical protein
MACVPIRRQMTCAGWQNRRPTPDAKLGGVAPVRAVLLDFYCTLVDLRDPVRSRGFDDLARRLGLLLGPGEFYRRYAEMISSEPAEDGGSGFVPYRTSWLVARAVRPRIGGRAVRRLSSRASLSRLRSTLPIGRVVTAATSPRSPSTS